MTAPFVAVHGEGVRVEVWRGSPEAGRVVYELRRGERLLASLRAPDGYAPHVALLGTHVALWAGGLVLADLTSGGSGTYDDGSGDVVTVLPYGGRVLVVTELAVSLRSPDLAVEHARYDHHEVILDARLDGNRLVARDFDGTELLLDAATLESAAAPEL
jgi:hypothetical protein